ncbi:MAG TPA: hypothetical protein RMH99_02270 [Sandaracinaceae bacterium LLY-WYZ-13_1]|nr:hypothetical protein [Sandaracinaceae bacterium LLY-WYZ-13_1]
MGHLLSVARLSALLSLLGLSAASPARADPLVCGAFAADMEIGFTCNEPVSCDGDAGCRTGWSCDDPGYDEPV